MTLYKYRLNPHRSKLVREEWSLRRKWVPWFMRGYQYHLVKKFVRMHNLHKLDVFYSRIGKGYSLSQIYDARIVG